MLHRYPYFISLLPDYQPTPVVLWTPAFGLQIPLHVMDLMRGYAVNPHHLHVGLDAAPNLRLADSPVTLF